METILIIILILSLITNAILLLYYIKSQAAKTNSTNDNGIQNSNDEIEKLKEQIDLLNSKNNSLLTKIEQLNLIIAELNSQKNYLADNIEKLEKLSAEKEEICTIAAHDIKNPAGTIKNLVNLLDNYDLTVSEQKQIHESLVNISTRIIKLVDEVARTVKKDVVSYTMNFLQKNIKPIIDLVANRYAGISKNKSIQIVKKEIAENIEVELDPDRIEEVIDNLVSNAMKFAPEGTKVELNTYTEENNLVFEVTDNGYGLSEDELQKAFLRGTTLSTKPTAEETSSGLGLWIVKRIIDEHSGLVWVKSKKGHGSTFAFKIPLKQNLIEN